MNIKPIKTEADHKAALAEVEALWGAPLNTPKGERLDVLVTLIEAYEAKHHPIYPPDPVEAIKFRMEQLSLEDKDLVPYLGQRSRVSEILNHKRALTLRMIKALHVNFGIPLESLMGIRA